MMVNSIRCRILLIVCDIFQHIQNELQAILSYNSLPWQRGLVVLEFVWHHSTARPRKTPIRKDLGNISYISSVIACFASIFIAMATRIVHSNLANIIRQPVSKNPLLDANISEISLIEAELQPICLKFRCHGNGGWSWQNLSGIIQQPDPPKTPYYTQGSRGYLLCKPSYSLFCLNFGCHGNKGHSQ